MTSNPRAVFFDGIAEKWDGWEDFAALERKLAAGLDELGVRADEQVVDVGCGTGNLTRALLARLSLVGRVVGVDFSQRKVNDVRVSWHVEDARRLLLADASCDRVICYSVWPHFEDRDAVAAEFNRVLKPGGLLHVWHLASRQKINEIHAGAGEAIRWDILPSVEETAALLATAGLQIATSRESDADYLVTGVKPACAPRSMTSGDRATGWSGALLLRPVSSRGARFFPRAWFRMEQRAPDRCARRLSPPSGCCCAARRGGVCATACFLGLCCSCRTSFCYRSCRTPPKRPMATGIMRWRFRGPSCSEDSAGWSFAWPR